MQFLSATKIFTGQEWVQNRVIVIENGIINSVLNKDECEPSAIQYFEGMFVPAFIDAQVYGAAGKLLAVYPQKETLQLMHEVFLKTGTVLFLPTLATNTIEVFKIQISGHAQICSPTRFHYICIKEISKGKAPFGMVGQFP